MAAAVAVIAEADADVLVLLGFDHDAELRALSAFEERLAAAGAPYPHLFAARPNAGIPTGVDIDGDGTWPEPQDAQGYGRFSGQGGAAILSRHPVGDVRDFSALPWRDLPGNRAAEVLDPDALAVLRLSTMVIWDAGLETAAGPLRLIVVHAGPPVFDGPEDRNGIRNEDETGFVLRYLEGWAPEAPPFAAERFAVIGTLNVDPARGEGRRGALSDLLSHPALQDPRPRDPEGRLATTNWDEPRPGRLRTDYILPAAGLEVLDAGVLGLPDDPEIAAASGHRLVWVDLALD